MAVPPLPSAAPSPETGAIAAGKSELRARLRFRRQHFAAQLDPVTRVAAFAVPPGPLRDMIAGHSCIGGYVAHGDEVDIAPMLTDLAADHAIALPWHAARDGEMQFRIWRPGDAVERGPWTMMQPLATAPIAEPTALLCPMLGFDRHGARLGQGQGHFDRYAAARPHITLIGIAWSIQECDALPIAHHDAALAVERFDSLEMPLGKHIVNQAGGTDLVTALGNEHPAVIQRPGRPAHGLQPPLQALLRW